LSHVQQGDFPDGALGVGEALGQCFHQGQRHFGVARELRLHRTAAQQARVGLRYGDEIRFGDKGANRPISPKKSPGPSSRTTCSRPPRATLVSLSRPEDTTMRWSTACPALTTACPGAILLWCMAR